VATPAPHFPTDTVPGTVPDADLELIEHAVRSLFRQSRSMKSQTAMQRRAGISLDRVSYGVLYHVGELGLARMSDVAHAVGAEMSTVSRQIATLEQRGLVQRTPDPDDGRAVRLALTVEGASMLAKMRDAWHARLAEAIETWPVEDVAKFATMLDRFVAVLADHGEF
jgi:DNA-binding MarR family transcriptional regulator